MTHADAEDRSPAWSPDGTRVAFLSARGGDDAKTRVWVMAADGGESRAVTPEKLDVQTFAWAPDGRSIAFVAADPKPEQKEKDEKAGRDWVDVDRDLMPRRLHIVSVVGAAGGSTRAAPCSSSRARADRR